MIELLVQSTNILFERVLSNTLLIYSSIFIFDSEAFKFDKS